MPTQNSSNQCPPGSVPYIIRKKDTLGNIAFFYNTTVQDIIRINPGIIPDVLQVGQQICVPLMPQMYPACPTTNYYVVVEGDTFESISNNFNVTAQLLLYSNYGIDPNDLYKDQVLCIPVAPSPVNIDITIGERKLVVTRNNNIIKTYRIGPENPVLPLPRGTFKVINKQVDPGGPFGSRWMGLSEPHYGIHGNNNPPSIGTAASNGCVRMFNNDVDDLFNYVGVGIPVTIF